MSRQERILINHVVSKMFGHHRKTRVSDEEWEAIEQKIQRSSATRQRLKELSEIPMDELDEECRNWLNSL
ncbi:MAG: hypothetical protein CL693_02625 [Cellvibrionaceae bacterium]|nr:hypothetical protein [Cellvibrionaceae bacterium]|tara:strand:- start:670 stop:879 length:210 start_codon:yes stop_codon:yes gene_type:complete